MTKQAKGQVELVTRRAATQEEALDAEVSKAIAATKESENKAVSTLDQELEAIVGETEKQAAPKAEKPTAEKKVVTPKEKKAPKVKATVTKSGHALMTSQVALDILARAEKAQAEGVKLDRKALSAEINIGVGTIADVLSGQPVIV